MRLILAVAAALVLDAIPSAALASPPTHGTESYTIPYVVGDVCAFPVQVASTQDEAVTTFYSNETGLPERANAAVSSTDVYSANGKTLTTEPFRYGRHVTFDATGNITAVIDTGVVARIRLPDGSMFVAAGRQEVLSGHTLLIPDAGTSNVTGFCAALSP